MQLSRLFAFAAVALPGAIAGRALYVRASRQDEQRYHDALPRTMKLTSAAFRADGPIPAVHTVDGEGTPPPLAWGNVPEGTQSIALTLTDYDVPSPAVPLATMNHWVVYNIPGHITSIPAAYSTGEIEDLGGAVGENTKGNRDFIAPAPPVGTHRYVFRVYALDTRRLTLGEGTKEELMAAMKEHVLGYGELIGVYGG